MPRRTLKRLTILLAGLLPVVLVLGIWWGGHPSSLPGPLRDLFVNDRVSTLDEALQIIHDDYYRRVNVNRLLDDSLAGAVQRLDDRFSSYLSPKDYARFQESSHG